MISLAADGGVGISAPASPEHPDDAVSWFRTRTPVAPELWEELETAARRRAFTVSGAASLDVVEAVWREIDRALAKGDSFEDFRRGVGERLAGWGGEQPPRLEAVFRTNAQTAYAAGRYRQMTAPDVIHARPIWMFSAILDSRTSPICRPLDGMKLPARDAFWFDHYPPLHHQCRSNVITLTEEQAAEYGGDATPDLEDADPPAEGFGGTPSLDEWHPNPADYPPELWAAFEQWSAHRD